MAGRTLAAPDLPPLEASPRSRLAPGVEAGVDEAMITRLVHAFYARARQDPDLGPIFEAGVDDWDAHLARLVDFWSSVMLMSGRFKGQPMEAHARLPVDEPHFARWLQLFARTAEEVCPPPAAALFREKSEMIARSLQLGVAARRGRF